MYISSIIVSILGLLLILKLILKRMVIVYEGKERLDGKTAIITGASSGIGAEISKDLANRGARVLMLCRDVNKGLRVRREIISSSGNSNVFVKHIDFSILENVRDCANEILKEESKIDILVNNAGLSYSKSKLTDDGLNRIMQINYFGPFLLTNILLGKVKDSAPCRIINTSSDMHSKGKLDFDKLHKENAGCPYTEYANSKLATIYFTNTLAEKLKGTGVTVNSLHPGKVNTDTLREIHCVLRYLRFILYGLFLKSPWEGAQTSIFLSVSPTVANLTGKYFVDCKEKSTAQIAHDAFTAEKLWSVSKVIVGLD